MNSIGVSAFDRPKGGRVVLSNLDRDLLNRCLAGTPEAWEDFVERYLGLITYVVSEVARSRGIELEQAVRDDVIADVFLALVDHDFRTLRRFRGQSSLGTYLVVVARRIAVRKLAEAQRRRQTGSLRSEPASAEAGDELIATNREEVQVLLGRLPTSEATAVRMYHLEDRSYREIGQQIGIPENSVGPLLSQARAKLRQMRQEA
jgi:RNA polymerase sigma-70 factor (ECF subfamily)